MRFNETVVRAGITGEQPVTAIEGFASFAASEFDDTAGNMIPGAAALVNRSRRIVLVTDRHVHLLRGKNVDRPKERLGTYYLGDGSMWFDGDRLIFHDGQVVYTSEYQAKIACDAAGVDFYARLADHLLAQAGITGERGVAVGRGRGTQYGKTSSGDRALDVVFGDATSFNAPRRQLLVVVTDHSVYVFHNTGKGPGEVLARYAVGPGTAMRDGDRVVFNDGRSVELGRTGETELVTLASTRSP